VGASTLEPVLQRLCTHELTCEAADGCWCELQTHESYHGDGQPIVSATEPLYPQMQAWAQERRTWYSGHLNKETVFCADVKQARKKSEIRWEMVMMKMLGIASFAKGVKLVNRSKEGNTLVNGNTSLTRLCD
jgi:hypothetical protein